MKRIFFIWLLWDFGGFVMHVVGNYPERVQCEAAVIEKVKAGANVLMLSCQEDNLR